MDEGALVVSTRDLSTWLVQYTPVMVLLVCFGISGSLLVVGHLLTHFLFHPGLYRGWCVTAWREVPAFGAYFALYDIFKDSLSCFFAKRAGITVTEMASQNHTAAWASSALAGGTTGALTWIMIYPFDIIKTRIQTAPMDTPLENRRLMRVGGDIIRKEGVSALFRGLNVTIMRAFPVNSIVFPVYEFCLMKLAALEY